MKTELTKLRNELYEALPIGDLDAWKLLQVIKVHLTQLDMLIDKLPQPEVKKSVCGYRDHNYQISIDNACPICRSAEKQ